MSSKSDILGKLTPLEGLLVVWDAQYYQMSFGVKKCLFLNMMSIDCGKQVSSKKNICSLFSGYLGKIPSVKVQIKTNNSYCDFV